MHRRTAGNAGFSLVEMVVVLAILTVLAGLIAPYLSVETRIERTEATMAYMDELEKALDHFGSDLYVYPSSLDELLENVQSLGGWRGPYTVDRYSATGTGNSGDYRKDAWSEDFLYTLTSSITARLRSAGDDRTLGTDDDLVKDLDLTPILRAETLRRELVINDAISNYNQANLPQTPLPSTSYVDLRAVLVQNGYLQDATWSLVDAWGDLFVILNPEFPPPSRIRSIHLDGSSPDGGGGTVGSGNGNANNGNGNGNGNGNNGNNGNRRRGNGRGNNGRGRGNGGSNND